MLALSITSSCNFHCKTCLREYPIQGNHIPVDLLEKALKEARKLQIGRVAITGGEPCLHPEFEKIVETIVKNGFLFGLVSNGSMPEKYEFLIEKYGDRILYISFSLDGATEDIHDYIRQPGSFTKVLDSVKFFSSRGIPTGVGVCLNKVNMHQIESIFQLAKNLGAQRIFFMGTIKTSHNGNIILSDEERKMCRSRIAALDKKHNIFIKTTSSLGSRGGVEFCLALNLDGITINPKGEVSFCCDNVGDGAIVGSLKNHSFYELYSKCLDLSCQLKKKRVEMLKAGKTMEGFNTCEFCNTFLEKCIKRPSR